MPIHTPDTVRRDISDGAGSPCGPYEDLLFSDSGGLTQFGALVEILPPGSSSSVKHWHKTEDEMIYVLEGAVTLHEGDSVTVMHPGEAATFAAGVAAGHRLVNASEKPVKVLVIGTRAPRDVITYPDNDRVLTVERSPLERQWTTLDGKPADSPYRLP
ncbi:MAG: cupin domain-containing protein [Silicimonas sp.]|nr:cupin domain-containing protein [Silicimonas sp.]